MKDQRPPISPMPPHLSAIGQEVVDRLKPMLDDAFDRIATAPGNPAERSNDALSAIAQVGAFVALQLTARLMLEKGATLDLACSISHDEIGHRLRAQLAELVADRP